MPLRSAFHGQRKSWHERRNCSMYQARVISRCAFRPYNVRSTFFSMRATTARLPSSPCAQSFAGKRCGLRLCSSNIRSQRRRQRRLLRPSCVSTRHACRSGSTLRASLARSSTRIDLAGTCTDRRGTKAPRSLSDGSRANRVSRGGRHRLGARHGAPNRRHGLGKNRFPIRHADDAAAVAGCQK